MYLVILLSQLLTSQIQIEGAVVDTEQHPIPGAKVVITSVRPNPTNESGGLTKCPTCYNECGMSTSTDAAGQFAFTNLDDALHYRLAIGKEGYDGKLIDFPTEELPLSVVLRKCPASQTQKFQGRVVDGDGFPIANALLMPMTISYGNRTSSRNTDLVSATVFSDSDGNFSISALPKVHTFTVRAYVPRAANTVEEFSSQSDAPVTFHIRRGASIRGRLVHEGRPVAGVRLGAVQEDRQMGRVVTPMEVVTQADGVFQFDHLPPNCDYAIYTSLQQSAPAVLPLHLVTVPGDGKRAELGDVPAKKPLNVKIRIRTSDKQPLPESSVVYLSRAKAWHSARFNIGGKTNPTITLSDASQETVQIRIRVPGYRVLSSVPTLAPDRNRSYPYNIGGNSNLAFLLTPESKPAP